MEPDESEASGTVPAGKPAPGLYIVATPIGNLEDVTRRAVRVLSTADLVLCEDTRVTGSLLRHLGIRATALQPYHEHNAARVRPGVLARLREGAVVALASDAGTPLVSDPGFKLVREAADEGSASCRSPAPRRSSPPCAPPGCRPTVSCSRASCRPSAGARARALDELAAVPGDAGPVRVGPAAGRHPARGRRACWARAPPRWPAS